MAVRPPLGVMPRYLWVESRLEDLSRAITEYTQAGLELDPDWVTEYNSLKASYHPPSPNLSKHIAASALAVALVDWSGHRVDNTTALALAYRYLDGEQNNSLAWTVFKNVAKGVNE